MSPIRLIIIGILLYIAYLLIKGSGTKRKEDPPSELHDPGEATDILVEDPVCKKLVPKQQAVSTKDGEDIIYFCSKECCNTFVSQKGAEQ